LVLSADRNDLVKSRDYTIISKSDGCIFNIYDGINNYIHVSSKDYEPIPCIEKPIIRLKRRTNSTGGISFTYNGKTGISEYSGPVSGQSGYLGPFGIRNDNNVRSNGVISTNINSSVLRNSPTNIPPENIPSENTDTDILIHNNTSKNTNSLLWISNNALKNSNISYLLFLTVLLFL